MLFGVILVLFWCFLVFFGVPLLFLHSELALGHWPSGAGAAQKSGGSATLPAGEDSIFILKYKFAIFKGNTEPVRYHMQCCGAATFLGGSGSGWPMSRSRLRLRPTWVGSGSRLNKAAPAPCTNIFH